MDYQNIQIKTAGEQDSLALSRTFVSNVFLWMAGALGITALVAYLFASTPSLLAMLFIEGTGLTIMGWIVMLAPIGFVLIMATRFQTMSYSTLTTLFVVYAALMGMSLSFILLMYTGESIAKTFIVCSSMFAIMGVLGYTTKTDLTKFGSILIMMLIGIVIASIVNIFLGSSKLELIISMLGVLIFTGLTAYDVQKLKRIGMGVEFGAEMTSKLVIMGALTLYLDFINLFLFLLRFLGNRK